MQSHTTNKVTSATKLLTAVGDWPDNQRPTPTSRRAHVQGAYGYKFFVHSYGEARTFLVLRASDADAVEVQTLIAYPDGNGHGTTTLRRLCDLADEVGATLWLDAQPFGRNREHIPLRKLKEWYRSFGFIAVRQPRDHWRNGYHTWDGTDLANVMLRLPQTEGVDGSASVMEPDKCTLAAIDGPNHAASLPSAGSATCPKCLPAEANAKE